MVITVTLERNGQRASYRFFSAIAVARSLIVWSAIFDFTIVSIEEAL